MQKQQQPSGQQGLSGREGSGSGSTSLRMRGSQTTAPRSDRGALEVPTFAGRAVCRHEHSSPASTSSGTPASACAVSVKQTTRTRQDFFMSCCALPQNNNKKGWILFTVGGHSRQVNGHCSAARCAVWANGPPLSDFTACAYKEGGPG